MADAYTLADLMRERCEERYSPPLNSGDTEIYDTSNVRVHIPQDSALPGFMRRLAERVRGASRQNNVLAEGVETAANWLDWRPRVGEDTLAPLGLASMGLLPAERALSALARVPTPVEWPTHAAVRIGDRIFTGNSHFDAVTGAQRALGENALAGGNVAADGFLTNQGRYVSREDAGRMLDQLNETRHYRTWLGNDKKGKTGLLSEALELYDPMTGRERR